MEPHNLQDLPRGEFARFIELWQDTANTFREIDDENKVLSLESRLPLSGAGGITTNEFVAHWENLSEGYIRQSQRHQKLADIFGEMGAILRRNFD